MTDYLVISKLDKVMCDQQPVNFYISLHIYSMQWQTYLPYLNLQPTWQSYLWYNASEISHTSSKAKNDSRANKCTQ